MKETKKLSTASNSTQSSSRFSTMLDREGFHMTSLLVPLTLIIVLSTVLLVVAAIFVGSFRLQLLTMASGNFLASPVLMIMSSCFSIVLAIVGFVVVLKKQLNLYTALGCLGLVVFLLHLVAVIFSFLLRDNVDSDFNKVNVDAQLSKAAHDNATMAVWDALQIRYKCCGGRGNSGFNEWESHLNGTYPDSCCTVKYPGCGRQAHRTLESDFTQTVYERIHVKGCVTAIKQSLEEYVMPLLLAWGLIGLMVLLAELAVILLCVVFTWHLKRRETRGTRLQLENSSGDSCPVHGGRKISGSSRHEDKQETLQPQSGRKISSASRQSRPSRSRRASEGKE